MLSRICLQILYRFPANLLMQPTVAQVLKKKVTATRLNSTMKAYRKGLLDFRMEVTKSSSAYIFMQSSIWLLYILNLREWSASTE